MGLYPTSVCIGDSLHLTQYFWFLCRRAVWILGKVQKKILQSKGSREKNHLMRKIIVCSTCRHTEEQKTDPQGRTGGMLLFSLLQEISQKRAETAGGEGEQPCITTQKCFWSCKQFCSVLFSDTERFSYLAARFQPNAQDAEAILDWFSLHGQTPDGVVAFPDWPEPIKGHFVARIPPKPSDL